MQTAANTSSAAVLRFFSLSTQSWIMQEGLLRLSMTLEVQGGMSCILFSQEGLSSAT